MEHHGAGDITKGFVVPQKRTEEGCSTTTYRTQRQTCIYRPKPFMQVHITEIKAPKGTIAQTCRRERAVSWDLTARRSLRAVLGPSASPASRSLQQMGCSRRLSPPSHSTSRYASAPELVALDLGFLLLWEGLRAACRASPRAKP